MFLAVLSNGLDDVPVALARMLWHEFGHKPWWVHVNHERHACLILINRFESPAWNMNEGAKISFVFGTSIIVRKWISHNCYATVVFTLKVHNCIDVAGRCEQDLLALHIEEISVYTQSLYKVPMIEICVPFFLRLETPYSFHKFERSSIHYGHGFDSEKTSALSSHVYIYATGSGLKLPLITIHVIIQVLELLKTFPHRGNVLRRCLPKIVVPVRYQSHWLDSFWRKIELVVDKWDCLIDVILFNLWNVIF